jgi:hypothetical protein
LDKLHQHLAALRLQRMLSAWTDREILAGSVIDQHIDREFSEAQLYLLLVSAAFLDSKYCYEHEFKRALEKFQRGEAIIVPVILRECDWQIPELKQFKALPLDGRPVVSRHWHTVDEAFTDVVSGLRKLIEGLPVQSVTGQPPKTKRKEDFVANETRLNPEHILSDAEREILFECAQDGELHILKVDAFGSWLRAGRKDFFNQTDPAVHAIYLDAFESLRGRGFIRQETGTFYRLTGIGFEEARRIATAKRGQT